MEKESTTGWLGKRNRERRKRQSKAQAKIISAGERVSCMMIMAKGCLGRRRRLFVELYRLVGDIWHGRGWKVVPRCLPTGDSLPNGRGIVSGRQSPCGRRWIPQYILLLHGLGMEGEIGSSDHVQEFRERWIREKHGRRGASSMWEGVRVCKWREIGPVRFRRGLLFWEQVSLIRSGVLNFCYRAKPYLRLSRE